MLGLRPGRKNIVVAMQATKKRRKAFNRIVRATPIAFYPHSKSQHTSKEETQQSIFGRSKSIPYSNWVTRLTEETNRGKDSCMQRDMN